MGSESTAKGSAMAAHANTKEGKNAGVRVGTPAFDNGRFR